VKNFLQKFSQKVTGVLAGFDRLVFKGTLRQLAHVEGMKSYLSVRGILLKDFGDHVEGMSNQLKKSVTSSIQEKDRPVIYLPSSNVSKEETARKIAKRDNITQGSIALLTCVEPCWSYQIFRNRESKQLELKSHYRKCLNLYHYQIHPKLGFMHTRIQSWFPFNIQVCINGREWLAKEMDRAGLDYVRRENCFTKLQNTEQAQQLMSKQLEIHWPQMLDGLAIEMNRSHSNMFGPFKTSYYWTTHQSEWATDIMFRNANALAEIYPNLVQHGIQSFSSSDVMRFLGHKVPAHGNVNGHFQGEVVSDLRRRPEGIRIKHRVERNSIKLYDKQGSVLRVETTINEPGDFKVYRTKEGDAAGKKSWMPMRKGVADLYRRAEISSAANNRYLDALGATTVTIPLGKQIAKLSNPAEINHQRVRPLRPWAIDDMALLQAVNRGEFVINGVRNRDLRGLLCESTSSEKDVRRQSACVGRKLRLLRAHGIIKKIPHTHRYQVTSQGRAIITALIAAHSASIIELVKLAA
jgi:hypothetical protein